MTDTATTIGYKKWLVTCSDTPSEAIIKANSPICVRLKPHCIAVFNGLPEMPISNITVKNVVMTEATDGVVISQVDGVTLENVYVESSKGNNILNVKNAKNLTVDGKVYEELGAKEEILSLK